jgi:catechol 2,3-dioxygenase
METTHAPSATTASAATRTGRLPDALTLGPTRLVVTDHARSIEWYRTVIGLQLVGEVEGDIARLGTANGTVVLELEQRPDARRAGRHAGLYHVALLFPSREELAFVAQRIARTRTMIDGASDHGTHEAIYLPDPDGNGLELAADRPRATWPNLADIEEIRPRPLDLHALLALVEGQDVPELAADGLLVGHLHLHVGDIARATAYYVDVVGFDPITMMDVAGFVSAGGYHHHLAFNTWRGVGVGPAPEDAVGLRHWVALVPDVTDLEELQQRLVEGDAEFERIDEGVLVTRDPWGNTLRVEVGAELPTGAPA